jgi:hypothetical protein
VDTAEMMGLVERTGAWYIIPGTDDKLQGRDKFVARVREDLDLQDKIKDMVNGTI